MTFTTNPPTTPGFYAWRHIAGNQPTQAFHVTEWLGELYGSGCCRPVEEMGGEWCRLVPVEEVEKAWCEARRGYSISDETIFVTWESSRAKQVAEGKI